MYYVLVLIAITIKIRLFEMYLIVQKDDLHIDSLLLISVLIWMRILCGKC